MVNFLLDINPGSTGFMLVCTSLVMLMTPALAFFYGGLATKRNILGIMTQSFVSLGWSTILWFVCGYSLCFSGSIAEGNDFFGILGNFGKAFFNGIDANSVFAGNGEIPEFVFIAFQMMFAIITPALITGAFVNRVSFKAFFIFLTAWQFFVYYPFCHMVWGGGLLAEWGVLDFAGGIVVHATAGFAALASVFFVGARTDKNSTPNSIPLVAIGTGLLWFGWYGFNAGSELKVDGITANAFLNTDVAASFALFTWMVIEWIRQRKPKFVGILTGSIAGLATITPCAGFVPLWAAPIIGICAGAGCYLAVELKNHRNWDDALDVWGVHGIGGVIGTILLGVFAMKSVNPNGADGLITGEFTFFGKEVVSVVIASVYAFVFTYLLLWVINKITPVRISKDDELQGIDASIHGEKAYDEGCL
ncbi:MAG: ammonium transporter [Bacteroidales bacterium]|jgi:Amt family ammonium transporter|nr:ammonium transporter [Bacteroidales bacterium]